MSKSPIETMMDQKVKWEILPPETVDEREVEFRKTGIPYATHSGVLNLFGVDMKCHRLNTGQAVFEADSMESFLAAMGAI
jgi:hypothetical protein